MLTADTETVMSKKLYLVKKNLASWMHADLAQMNTDTKTSTGTDTDNDAYTDTDNDTYTDTDSDTDTYTDPDTDKQTHTYTHTQRNTYAQTLLDKMGYLYAVVLNTTIKQTNTQACFLCVKLVFSVSRLQQAPNES
jgi:hypothetical protein